MRGAVEDIVADRIGRNWCLFLDRDGVINRQIVGDYVRNWRQFEWMPGARLSLRQLREWAPHVVIVTNQQGIGKGLMSANDVAAIHGCLQAELEASGVKIDGFQVCPHLAVDSCRCRKPEPGLVFDWLAQHPTCEPSLSVMVGDSQSDAELARNVATAVGSCASIQIGGEAGMSEFVDATFGSLLDFAVAVGRAREEHGS